MPQRRKSAHAPPRSPAAGPAARASQVYAGLFSDPTVLFTAAVLCTPLLFVRTFSGALAYLLQPLLLASYALFAGVLWFTARGRCVPLSAGDLALARWALCNGVYYNLFLDVFAGQFQLLGEMTVQYNRVEPRYALGAGDPVGAPVFFTSMMELLFQAPLGLLTFCLVHRGAPGRHTAALVLSVLHAAGVWYFYVPEALNGFKNLGGWPKTAAEAVSFERLLFFWFGFWFCGLLWTTVAVIVGARAARAIAAAVGPAA
jgi:hypothetical protein